MLPHRVAVQMMPMIHRMAHQLARRLPRHVCVDDLIGAGFEGLVVAYSRFDRGRSHSFEAYAECRIRGAMLDTLRASDPLSREQRAQVNRIMATTRALYARHGRAPSVDEVAAELGVSLDAYWERVSATTTSVDWDADVNILLVDDPQGEPADEQLSRKEMTCAIHHAVAALPARLQQVLDLHYSEGLTLRQIGELFHVTESRVCQLESEAIRRIRERCKTHLADTHAFHKSSRSWRRPRALKKRPACRGEQRTTG